MLTARIPYTRALLEPMKDDVFCHINRYARVES
jgi:hypothetical protein